jgi:hypothetical protein
MTYYIDLKYAKLLGGRLPNFKQKRGNVFAFSHSCEDASKGRVKARANFYQVDDAMMFHCYHCSSSSLFSNFLRSEDPSLYQEYRMETFKESKGGLGTGAIFKKQDPTPTVPIQKKSEVIDSSLIPITSLDTKSGVMAYINSRRIPEEYHQHLFVAKDFYSFASKYDEIFTSISKVNRPHPRLVFPFLDQDGSVICYSGRSFGDEQPKYVTVMVDKNRPKIYGLWKLDINKDIIAVEGQIDSLFLDNAIAVNGADYGLPFLTEHRDRIIVVPDSDWKRNRQVYKSLETVIDSGFRVALLPESVPWKDINDCVVKGGLSRHKLMELIRSNVTSGLRAKLELSHRKKF